MTVRYLFDTHVCLHLIRSGAGELRSLFETCAPGEIAVSSLTLAALRARAQNSRHPQQNRQALEQFVLPLVVVDFDAEAAQWLGKLAARAEAQGRAAGQEEMLAAQALRLHAELVTSRPDLYTGMEDLRLTAVGVTGAAQGQARDTRSPRSPAHPFIRCTGYSSRRPAHHPHCRQP